MWGFKSAARRAGVEGSRRSKFETVIGSSCESSPLKWVMMPLSVVSSIRPPEGPSFSVTGVRDGERSGVRGGPPEIAPSITLLVSIRLTLRLRRLPLTVVLSEGIMSTKTMDRSSSISLVPVVMMGGKGLDNEGDEGRRGLEEKTSAIGEVEGIGLLPVGRGGTGGVKASYKEEELE